MPSIVYSNFSSTYKNRSATDRGSRKKPRQAAPGSGSQRLHRTAPRSAGGGFPIPDAAEKHGPFGRATRQHRDEPVVQTHCGRMSLGKAAEQPAVADIAA